MKINKKIFGLVIATAIVFSGGGFNNGNLHTIQTVEAKQVEKVKKTKRIKLNKLKTYKDVDEAYLQNLEKIMNKEQIQNKKDITFEKVLKYAEKSSKVASTAKSNSQKIDTVDKLVSLDDLSNNTSREVMEECIKYMMSEYEKNQLQDKNKALQYQYIARYLDKRLDNHPNMKDAHDMVFDMYQIAKDTFREDNSSMEANFHQVDKKIKRVKWYLQK